MCLAYRKKLKKVISLCLKDAKCEQSSYINRQELFYQRPKMTSTYVKMDCRNIRNKCWLFCGILKKFDLLIRGALWEHRPINTST